MNKGKMRIRVLPLHWKDGGFYPVTYGSIQVLFVNYEIWTTDSREVTEKLDPYTLIPLETLTGISVALHLLRGMYFSDPAHIW